MRQIALVLGLRDGSALVVWLDRIALTFAALAACTAAAAALWALFAVLGAVALRDAPAARQRLRWLGLALVVLALALPILISSLDALDLVPD